MVEKVNVLGRSGHRVKYRIDLVDFDIIKLMRNVVFTNHGKKEEKNIGAIISRLFTDQGLKFATNTSSHVKTNIDYISKLNDNLMTAFRFLIRRDFFYGDTQTNSLNIVTKNLNTREYGIYNLMDPPKEWILGKFEDKIPN